MKPSALNIDLHCHSTVSDGALAPRDVAQRAHANGVDVWALTDHDEVGGLAEAAAMADELGMRFATGVEISVTWAGLTVHIVGLRFDPLDAAHDTTCTTDGRSTFIRCVSSPRRRS